MLYWQNTDITKTGRDIMVSQQPMVWTTKFYYLLVKCMSHCLRNMPMWLVLCGTELLHLFLGICCSHTHSVSIHPPKHLMLPSLDCLQLYGCQHFQCILTRCQICNRSCHKDISWWCPRKTQWSWAHNETLVRESTSGQSPPARRISAAENLAAIQECAYHNKNPMCIFCICLANGLYKGYAP